MHLKHPRDWHLRTRLLVILLSLTLLPLIGTSIIGAYQNSNTLSKSIQDDYRILANTRAESVEELLTHQIDLLQLLTSNNRLLLEIEAANALYPQDEQLARSLVVALDEQWNNANEQDSLVRSRTQGLMAEELRRFQLLTPAQIEIFFTDRYGSVVATTNRDVDLDHYNEAWWQAAWNAAPNEVIMWTQERTAEDTGFTCRIAIPVTDQTTGEQVGVLQSVLSLDILQHLFSSYAGAEQPQTILVNRDNIIMAATDPAYIGQTPPISSLDTENSIFLDETLDGERAIVAQHSVTPTVVQAGIPIDWKLFIIQTEAKAFATIYDHIQTSIFFTLIAAFAAVVSAIFLGNRLSRPIIRLSEAAHEGDLKCLAREPVIDGKDEIGVLGQSIHRLAQNLLNTMDELESVNRNLESIVIERTVDLQDALHLLEQRNIDLSKAKTQADEANQLKSRFLATMSHELRTPLNAIIGFSQIIPRYGDTSERQANLLRRITVNGEHLLGLINDILDLSKIEAGRMELSFAALNVRNVVDHAVEFVSSLAQEKSLPIHIDIPALFPYVWADQLRLRQILLNLLSNAIKFTNEGYISIRAIVDSAKMVKLYVEDTGIGIAEEFQHLVFEEFRQIQGDLTREYTGTGLGLPITKRLIEMHGGTLWLESTVDQGSTFSFTIPIAMIDQSTLFDGEDTPNTDQIGKIMIIDDSEDDHQIFHELLQATPYKVISVLDSRNALSFVQNVEPDVLILDIQMPYLTGWDVLSLLRSHEQTAGLPVVICSVIDNTHIGTVFNNVAYMTKPVNQEALIVQIEQLCKPLADTNVTILIVDDHEDTRQLLCTYLEKPSIHILQACDGVEAIKVIQQHPQIDLMIVDLMMPNIDGFEVVNYVRSTSNLSNIPIVVVSSKDLEPQEREFLLSRSALYLQKHRLSREGFVQLINSLYERSKA